MCIPLTKFLLPLLFAGAGKPGAGTSGIDVRWPSGDSCSAGGIFGGLLPSPGPLRPADLAGRAGSEGGGGSSESGIVEEGGCSASGTIHITERYNVLN